MTLLDALVDRPRTHPWCVTAQRGMPDERYRELAAAFPAFRPGTRDGCLGAHRAYADQFLSDKALPRVWRQFWDDHLSPAFTEAVLGYWRNDLEARYPQIAALDPRSIRIRETPCTGKEAFELNGQFVQRDSVLPKERRGMAPHIDNARSVVFFLWYFREAKDHSDGGDLVFYKTTGPLRLGAKSRVPVGPLAPVSVVPYAANNLVMVFNTPEAIHGVTGRKSKHPRRNVGLTIELGDSKLRRFARTP